MICCLPYGVIFLTAFYLVFCLLIGTQLPECIVENEETDTDNCGTEGVDNSVLAWSTSYFVANIIGFIALHIWWKSSKRIIGGIAFVCMTIALVFHGIAARFFGNSGIDDGNGMKGFYVTTCVSYFLMTLSAFLFAFIGRQSWQCFESSRPMCCGRTEMVLFVFLLGISCCAVIFGCVTTLSLGDDVLVKNIFDEYPNDPYQVPLSLAVVDIGTKLWNAFYSLFLISLAIILGMATKDVPVKVAGLPNSLGAAGIVLVQGVVGIFRAVLISISMSQDVEESTVYRAAPAIFNYSILMTAFFLHNLIVSLFPKYPEDMDDSKHGSQTSMDRGEICDIEAQHSFFSKDSTTKDPESSNGLPRATSHVTGYSQSDVSNAVTEQSSQQAYDISLLPRFQLKTSEQVSKHIPNDDQTSLESERIEVMGIAATNESMRRMKNPIISVSTRFMSLWSRNQGDSYTVDKDATKLDETPRTREATGKVMSAYDDASKSEQSETTFGSQILKKTKPVYENGSLTSFGSEMLQKVRMVEPSNKTNGHGPGKEQASIGFKKLQEAAADKSPTLVFDETTFGSQVLQKVKKVYQEEDSLMEDSGIEIVGVASVQRLPMLNRSKQKNTRQTISQGNEESSGSITTFGSEILHKAKKPEYESESDDTFTWILKRDEEDSLSSSSTSFGSERLIKANPKLMRYETDGSVTTFGSELLMKSKVEYRACESESKTAAATNQATGRNIVSSRASPAIPIQDTDSECSNASSSRRLDRITATDPAHLENMDKVYNWMSKFIPFQGGIGRIPDDVSEGVQEEFEIKLGTLDTDDATEVKASEANSQATELEEEEQAQGLMSRLRPMRKKKKSYREAYQQPQQALDIPNAIEEDVDEESTTASSISRRVFKARSRKVDVDSVNAVVRPVKQQPPPVEEKRSYDSPVLMPVSKDPAFDEKPQQVAAPSMPVEARARSGGSVNSGYSTDNSTLFSTASKPIIMTHNPLEGGIPQELVESRDDDYTTDSDEEDSVSYGTSTAAPSVYQIATTSDGNADDVSQEGTAISSVSLNKTPQKAKAGVGPSRAQRQRQVSTLG